MPSRRRPRFASTSMSIAKSRSRIPFMKRGSIQELTAKYNRVTQMGTHIHAGDNYRRVVEIIKAGVLGQMTEVHVWCGKDGGRSRRRRLPSRRRRIFITICGSAPRRSTNTTTNICPPTGAGLRAYGDGTLGDMACHYCDLPFWALDLGHPTKISAEGPPVIRRMLAGLSDGQLRIPGPRRTVGGQVHVVRRRSSSGQVRRWPKNARAGERRDVRRRKRIDVRRLWQHHLYPEERLRRFHPAAADRSPIRSAIIRNGCWRA